VIEKDVEWENSRSYFFWRLRRKLAEFDLRKKMMAAGNVGRGIKAMGATEASAMIRDWYLASDGSSPQSWNDDKIILAWMGENNHQLEVRVADLARKHVADEVFSAMSAGGNTSQIGIAGIVEGISRAMSCVTPEQREALKNSLKSVLNL